MTQTAATVRRHVVVDTPIDRAFFLFTEHPRWGLPLPRGLLYCQGRG